MIPPAAAWAQFLDYPVEPFQARLLGIRGYFRSEGLPDQNDVNIYDDLIVLCNGPERCHEFRASVDPGFHYIEHPINEHGCACLAPGLWMFKEGTHRHQHTCLVQAGNVTVERMDKRGAVSAMETGEFAIHIHSGGARETVDSWSAGCQIIYDPETGWGPTWRRFLTLTLEAMKAHKQDTIPYLLVDRMRGYDQQPEV